MNAPRLSMPRALRAVLIRQAKQARPSECCGFLLGAGGRVQHAIAMRNVARGVTRYRVDPEAHIALRRVLRQCVPVLEIVGVYHSHPSGKAVASPTDVAEAMYPEWAYVIVGLAERRPTIRAFSILRGLARPLPVRWRGI